MKTLLVLLLVSGLVAESSAWPKWEQFKESVKGKYGDVESFFQGIGKKAKDFVTGKKGEFVKLSNALKDKLKKLEECEKCDGGACNDNENIECEELYIDYAKVRDFMDCVDDPTREDCALNLGRAPTPPPKRALSQRRVGIPAQKKVEEEDDDTEPQKQERRVAVLLRALLKKTEK